ncbi:ankyrin repeat domain-containing protein 7-like [Dendronephthya gigantea]|uniref:ankyrin repeat domain-containing protein 7-like n=1 Tax=Dendronephthya gigantea TaxID=151771 RepID=UPI00106A24D9|nr:ankyrin repeat domain-containing protein 7-like [Dendronephthya gigantea]
MGSKSRSYRHSFYGTALADETRIEKRYHQVRRRRLSAFQEVDPKQNDGTSACLTCRTLSCSQTQRNRSNSLPDAITINSLITKMENDTAASINLVRPRSVSFDPTAKLYTAAAENDITELKAILDSGKADPNILYLSGVTPLHMAAAEGHLDAIELLVQYGANINIQGAEGFSPLEFALRGGHFDCASFLIKVGAETKKIVHGLN